MTDKAYEELVDRCAKKYVLALAEDDVPNVPNVIKAVDEAWERHKDDPAREQFCAATRAVIAEIARTLETEAGGTGNGMTGAVVFRRDLLSWLRDSPLFPFDKEQTQ